MRQVLRLARFTQCDSESSQANDELWHVPFNRLENLNEHLVKGREDISFGAKLKGLPDDVIKYYLDMLRSDPVGFQNSATASDQRFQAAGSYWLISPPRTGRRRILPWTGSGTGDSGRGGRSCSARCGRCVL